jgi:uroporphyrinogen-III synthase
MRLLLTRPEHDAERTAAVLRARGHDVMLAPMLHIEPVVPLDFGMDTFAAVLMTSANAARALANHLRRDELQRLPAFVVGRHTAEAARTAGFRDVASADGNQDDLVRLIAARRLSGALLYLAGADRSGDLAGALAPNGVTVRTVVAYHAVAAASFTPAVRAALSSGRPHGALHFSHRSADAFLACALADGVLEAALALAHFCLSAQVAEPLRQAGAGRVRVAAHPDESSLIELLN